MVRANTTARSDSSASRTDGVLGHKAVKGTECLGNPLPLLREEQNVPKNVVFGDNA